jgi:hypothetical protein
MPDSLPIEALEAGERLPVEAAAIVRVYQQAIDKSSPP